MVENSFPKGNRTTPHPIVQVKNLILTAWPRGLALYNIKNKGKKLIYSSTVQRSILEFHGLDGHDLWLNSLLLGFSTPSVSGNFRSGLSGELSARDTTPEGDAHRWRRNVEQKIIQPTSSLKVPERYEKCLRVSSSVKGKRLPTLPSGREWATSQTTNVGRDRMNSGIKILPLLSTNEDFSFFPSVSLLDVLCDHTDLIWREGTSFEVLTGRTAFSTVF